MLINIGWKAFLLAERMQPLLVQLLLLPAAASA
jgi:hypothetical protein